MCIKAACVQSARKFIAGKHARVERSPGSTLEYARLIPDLLRTMPRVEGVFWEHVEPWTPSWIREGKGTGKGPS